MKYSITLKQFNTYLLFPIVVIIATFIEVNIYLPIGFLEYWIGIIQLVWSLILTIYIIYKKAVFPNELKFYWKLVVIYFLVIIVFIGIWILFKSENDPVIFKILFCYSLLAIPIAIYHFKHIMFLKIKRNEN